MAKSRAIAAINKILLDEKRYAARLQERGDFGQAKLALAALAEIKGALKSAALGEDEDYVERLVAALHEAKASYCALWDDPDGIGSSTFSRVLDQLDAD